ncbi:DUF805 domain-containing protein [Sphingobacterium deserti]|uniref:DUF805 domain-containing protein n=1 Tax=Sphingobacterium deserti TaxID=1229276 RepID=A0A0B8T9M2_9SPHI|nr:DUF805 domain-containing protein [Sphingobacterium deserti]KGE14710.1 hypothetical protein DI53_1739 [Sphingobacterium deserti]
MEWFLKVVRDNYANFEGRARRKEYWMYMLVLIGIYIALLIVGGIFTFISDTLGMIFTGLLSLVGLAVLIPTLAVGVRRLHDTSCPTWYIVFYFIPLVNIYFLYLMIKEGDVGPNEFGPDPKAGDNGGNPFTNFPPTPNNPFNNPNP